MATSNSQERIVMTPKRKTATSTTLAIERKAVASLTQSNKLHVGGGQNAGIVVVSASADKAEAECHFSADVALHFRVFLVNSSTGRYTQERRELSFWFKEQQVDRAGDAQDFFKKLVSPKDFPRDYVGFIKRMMKLMQNEHPLILRIELSLTQEKEMDNLPNAAKASVEERREVHNTDVLAALEESYPNSLTIDDIARSQGCEAELVRSMVSDLVARNLIKAVGGHESMEEYCGATAFRRVHVSDGEVQVVRHMPKVDRELQPTIAVITAHFQEKMAVDAVMSNKQTFLRYATVGEANVYTLGDLGPHRAVTTKLPMTGGGRAALIAAGGTTTRLLGIFQEVERVFLVGVAAALPHYTDHEKHVRLGDVVVADADEAPTNCYVRCDKALKSDAGRTTFEVRQWTPANQEIQDVAKELVAKQRQLPQTPWLKHFEEALQELDSTSASSSWRRPSASSDRLYMSVSSTDVIEVDHPVMPESTDPEVPRIHFGPVVSAAPDVATDSELRLALAEQTRAKCFDAELHAVIEAVVGSRKDRFCVIRGMAKYDNGLQSRCWNNEENKEEKWENYAALMAAAFLKAVVMNLSESD